jgi:hypothetical protein
MLARDTCRAGTSVRTTVSLVRDGDVLVVIDRLLVMSRAAIIDPLVSLGYQPGDVTDVVLSRHHPITP